MPFASIDEQSGVLLLNVKGAKKCFVAPVIKLIHIRMYQENRRRDGIRTPKRAVLNISLRKLPRRAPHAEVGPGRSDIAAFVALSGHFSRGEFLRPIHSKETADEIRPSVQRHNGFISLALRGDPQRGETALAETQKADASRIAIARG